MSKICPSCKNANNLDSDKFCYRDGTHLIQNTPCECGRPLIPQFKFCPKCGKKNVTYADPVKYKEISDEQTQSRS